MPMQPREGLSVALDLSSVEAAQPMVAKLGDAVSFYKIGYQLAYAGGLAYVSALTGAGKRVFLDLKLHDIGHTVAQGVKSVANSGASFLTVHAYPQTMKAAVDARAGQARDIGVDGVVCSAEEAANIRAIVGTKLALVTPGIRPVGAEAGDQKRVMTPAKAIAAGADYLVVGRPILAAPDPKTAAEAIVAEIASAKN